MTPKSYSSLAISNSDDLVFGRAPLPVTLPNRLAIGGGTVYPELNFTLPSMEITAATMPEVLRQYTEMIDGACRRADDLNTPGLVVEFELLPPITIEPEWGAEVTKLLRARLDLLQSEHQVKVGPRDSQRYPGVCAAFSYAHRRLC